MNMTQQRTVYAGIALVALGIIALLNLWWLVPVALFAGVGYVVYSQRRAMGRYDEAVQGGLWGFGMALLWIVGIFPGIILLAGASLLARGREAQVDAQVQRLLGQGRAALQARRSVPSSSAPVAPQRPTNITIVTPDDQPSTGETTRLQS